MTGLFRAGVWCALAVMATACAATVGPPAVPVTTLPPPPVVPSAPAQEPPYREIGTAAWYGLEMHGKKTASGEVFDMHGLSAAHRTLPLGAVVRITNPENSHSILVKINDRGPFTANRVLELSYGAARELGFVEQGTARVELETRDAIKNTTRYTVQAATYAEKESARMLKERLSKKFQLVFIAPLETNLAVFYRVRIGSYTSRKLAERVAEKLMLEGLEPFVLRKD